MQQQLSALSRDLISLSADDQISSLRRVGPSSAVRTRFQGLNEGIWPAVRDLAGRFSSP